MELLSRVDELVSEELKIVSYKWASRHFDIPSNDAKRLLYEYAEAHKGKVDVVYLLAGWTKEDVPRHTMQLVSEARLEAARDALGTVSGFHVYSLAAVAPKDAAALCSLDYIQASELHLQPQDRSNCLRDNRHSAVRCPMVRRVQADLRGTVASVSAAPKQAPAPKSAPTPQPDTAPIPKPAPAAAGPIQTEKPLVEENAKTEPAPTGAKKGSGSIPLGGSTKAAKGNAGKARMQSMFAKAPPAKAKVAAPPPAARALAGDADSALRMELDDTEANSEDDEMPVVNNSGARRRARVVMEEEEEEEEMDKAAAASPLPAASSAGRRRPRAVIDDEEEEEMELMEVNEKVELVKEVEVVEVAEEEEEEEEAVALTPNPAKRQKPANPKAAMAAIKKEAAAKKEAKKKADAEAKQAKNKAEEAEAAAGKKPSGGLGFKARDPSDPTSPQSSRLPAKEESSGAGEGGSKKKAPLKRVVRTNMDDRGIETTEVVFVDEDGNEFASAAGLRHQAATTAPAKGAPVAAAGTSKQAAQQDTEDREDKASKSAATKEPKTKEPKASAKATAGKKAASGSKNIMSFFGKK